MLRSAFKKYFTAVTKTLITKVSRRTKKHLSSELDFESFHLPFKTTLDRFVSLPEKVVQNNNQSFMTKTLRKATIMQRSKL